MSHWKNPIFYLLAILLLLVTITGALAYEEVTQNPDGTITKTLYGSKRIVGNFTPFVAPQELQVFGYRKYYDFERYKLYIKDTYGNLPILLYIPESQEQINFKLEKVGYVLSTDMSNPTFYNVNPMPNSIQINKYSLIVQDIFPGVHLRYKLNDQGFSEDIIVQAQFRNYVVANTPANIRTNPNAFLIFVFRMEGKDLPNNFVGQRNGVMLIEKSYWEDANGTRGETFLGKVPNQPFIVKGARFVNLTTIEFPLIIDPTTNLGQSLITADLYASDGSEVETFIRWNISSIPAGAMVSSATQTLYISSLVAGMDTDLTVSRVANQTWTESETAANLDSMAFLNSTASTLSSITDDTFTSASVTSLLISDVGLNNHFATIIWSDPDNIVGAYSSITDNNGLYIGDNTGGGLNYLRFEDRENSLATSNFPALSVTYALNISPIITEPLTDRSRIKGEKYNLSCFVSNNLTFSITNTLLELQFPNGTLLSDPPFGLNQSASQSCGTLAVGATCNKTWTINATEENEENTLVCELIYSIGTKTSTVESNALKINNINLSNDLGITLSSPTVVIGDSITAEMTTTIISEQYTVLFLKSDGTLIDSCSYNSITPATENTPFFQSCTIPVTETNDSASRAVFYLTSSPQNNVTILFSIISIGGLNQFSFENLTYKTTSFLGDNYFISAYVKDVNGSFAIGECCRSVITDSITNTTIAVSDEYLVGGLGKCQNSIYLQQIPFSIDTSYKFSTHAYECNHPTATYSERKYGSTTGSFNIISHITQNSISSASGNDIVAGLSNFETTFNFTNNYGLVLNTITDCYYVDSHEQDYHIPELDDMKSTLNLGTIQQTFGSLFPSMTPSDTLFSSGTYLLECLMAIKGDTVTKEIKRLRSSIFNLTSTNDSIILLNATLSKPIYGRGETAYIETSISSKKNRDNQRVVVYLESVSNGRNPSYQVAELTNYQLALGTNIYNNSFLLEDKNGAYIQDGDYFVHVHLYLEDGFLLDADLGILTINSSIVDLREAIMDSNTYSSCQEPYVNISYSYFGDEPKEGIIETHIESVQDDYFLSRNIRQVEFTPGTNETLRLPLLIPYVKETTQAEIQLQAYFAHDIVLEGFQIDELEEDLFVPQFNITTNLTEECYFKSLEQEIEYRQLLALRNKTVEGALNFTQVGEIDYRPFWLNITSVWQNATSFLSGIRDQIASLVQVQNQSRIYTIEAMQNQTTQFTLLNSHQYNQTLALYNISASLQTHLADISSRINNLTMAVIDIDTSLQNISAEMQVTRITENSNALTTLQVLQNQAFLMNQSVQAQNTLTLKVDNNTLAIERQTTNMTVGLASITSILTDLVNATQDQVLSITNNVTFYGNVTDPAIVSALQGISTSIDNTTIFLSLQTQALNNISVSIQNQTLTQQVMMDAIQQSIDEQTTFTVRSIDNLTIVQRQGMQNVSSELSAFRQDQNVKYDLLIQATGNVSNATLELKTPLQGMVVQINSLNGTLSSALNTINVNLDELNTYQASQVLVGQNITQSLNSLNATQTNHSVALSLIAGQTIQQTSILLSMNSSNANWTLQLVNLNTNLTQAIYNSTATNQDFYSYVLGTLKEPLVTSVTAIDRSRSGGIVCEGSIYNGGITNKAVTYTLFVTQEALGNLTSALDSESGSTTVRPGETFVVPATLDSSYLQHYCVFQVAYDSKEQIARYSFIVDDQTGVSKGTEDLGQVTGQIIQETPQQPFPWMAVILIALIVLIGVYAFKKRQ